MKKPTRPNQKSIKVFSKIKNKFSSIKTYIEKNPRKSFYISLSVLLILIIISNILGSEKATELQTETAPKEVRVLTMQEKPVITVSAKVDKSGVLTISALTGGVVSKIYHSEGSQVKKGTTLASIATDYSGANTFALQASLAQTQYQGAVSTYDDQKNIINKQREIAEKTYDNSQQLNEITIKSIDEIRSLSDLNKDIISRIDANIAVLEADPVANADLILASKQVKSQFLAASNSASQALRQIEYSTDLDNPPQQLNNLSKELTLANLAVQEKMLDVSLKAAKISANIAGAAALATKPSAPFAGVVQKVFVNVGQPVSPGTPLFVISQRIEDDPITAVAYLSRQIAASICQTCTSTLYLDGKKLEIVPDYVSSEAVAGELYSIKFTIDDQYSPYIANKSSISIDLALLTPQDSEQNSNIYLPSDAVVLTEEGAYVYIVKGAKAQSTPVQLGQILAGLVQITKGINPSDKIILDRTVVDGTPVQILK